MSMIRTLGAATVVPGTPTPVLFAAAGSPFTKIQAASFSISKGIATITLGVALPTNGYNGVNGFPTSNATTHSKLDIHGGVRGYNNTGGTNQGGGGAGQQVTLWGFTTATYFNGLSVTVLDNDGNKSFRFYFNDGSHTTVATTSDTGYTAPNPFEHYRAIRLECGQGNTTDFVYVGEQYVSSSQYLAAISLAGQLSIEIASENIPAERVMIDGDADTDTVQCAIIY